ncbi:MAG: hypothetical protein ABEJ23_02925 [Haloarculaceae archaeon]
MRQTTSGRIAALAVAMLVVAAVAPGLTAAATTETVGVETTGATHVTTTNATFSGNLTALQADGNATVWFEYWQAGDEANASTTANRTMSAPGTFVAPVSDLQSNTTYVVVAHAETANASDDGDQVTFTTDAVESVGVETTDATYVSDDSAVLNGDLTEIQGAENATVWFEYWQAGDEANASTTSGQTRSAPGAFSTPVSGLQNNTTYHYVAYAETANASDAGNETAFTTLAQPANLSVSTHAATDVTASSATLNGGLDGTGAAENATVWFEYWQAGDEANASTTSGQTLSAPGGFAASASDLQNNTTYHYVAHAEANGTTVNGSTVSFTTSAQSSGEDQYEGPFGLRVSAFVHRLLGNETDQPLGWMISKFVTANNPGAAHRPDHAGPKDEHARGPPWDQDHGAENGSGHGQGARAAGDDHGRPDHAGAKDRSDHGRPSWAGGEDDTADATVTATATANVTANATATPTEDGHRGPPEHARGHGHEEDE